MSHGYAEKGRLPAIDFLRGCALLGIFVLNVDYFAGPMIAHGVAFADFDGAHGGANRLTLYLKWIFFEGKARGLFAMLFGVSALLMLSKAESDPAHRPEAADLYYRRNLGLLVIGLMHGILIWDGDILFSYAVIALLVLYPLRKLRARTLFIIAPLLSLLGTASVFFFLGFKEDLSLAHRAVAIEDRVRAGVALTADERDIQQEWTKLVEKRRLTPEKAEEQVRSTIESSYAESVKERIGGYTSNLFDRYVFLWCEYLSAMLLGLALLRTGFLTGEWRNRHYLLTAALGFGVSAPLYFLGVTEALRSGLDFIAIEKYLFLPYYLTRDTGMLAIAASLILVYKHAASSAPVRWMIATGRMALTNYILTSLVCQLVFVWGPWKLYGRMDYYQLNAAILVAWIVYVVLSTRWLRHFRQGPLEWVWRSLVRGEALPMRPSAATTV